MRVTERMMMDNAIQNMAMNKERLHVLQNKVASGKEFEYASEAPGRASLSPLQPAGPITASLSLSPRQPADGRRTGALHFLFFCAEFAQKSIAHVYEFK